MSHKRNGRNGHSSAVAVRSPRSARARSADPKETYPKPPFPAQHQEQPGLETELKPLPLWKGERYKPADKLAGMRALITGGDSGIGRSVAYHFAREGADVVITCLPEEEPDAEITRLAIEKLGRRCHVICGDLAESRFCDECVDETFDELGGLDILVHNAAHQSRKTDVTDVTDDELDRTMKVNVYALVRLARAAVPRMPKGSSILSTGSIVGLQGSARLADYSATKGALHTLTRTMAEELLDRGIRVNCVAPGPVWTPLNVADPGLTAKEVSSFGQDTGKVKMGRPAQPEEVAPAFVFLASPADSSYITGIILPVTGEPA